MGAKWNLMKKYMFDENIYQKCKICLLNMTHDGITHKIIDISPCISFSCWVVSYQKKAAATQHHMNWKVQPSRLPKMIIFDCADFERFGEKTICILIFVCIKWIAVCSSLELNEGIICHNRHLSVMFVHNYSNASHFVCCMTNKLIDWITNYILHSKRSSRNRISPNFLIRIWY